MGRFDELSQLVKNSRRIFVQADDKCGHYGNTMVMNALDDLGVFSAVFSLQAVAQLLKFAGTKSFQAHKERDASTLLQQRQQLFINGY